MENDIKIKAYQVGENDIVAANSPEQALFVFSVYVGSNDIELDEVSECDLETKLVNESGEWEGETLGDLVALHSVPCYLFVWE